MSTQYTDHNIDERARALRPTLHGVPSSAAPVDHRRLAQTWLRRDECIHALRVADPGRGRFSPLKAAEDGDSDPHWQPAVRRTVGIDQLFPEHRLLMKIHADWIVLHRPYAQHD